MPVPVWFPDQKNQLKIARRMMIRSLEEDIEEIFGSLNAKVVTSSPIKKEVIKPRNYRLLLDQEMKWFYKEDENKKIRANFRWSFHLQLGRLARRCSTREFFVIYLNVNEWSMSEKK